MLDTLRTLAIIAVTILGALYVMASMTTWRWAGLAVVVAIPVAARLMLDRPDRIRSRRWKRGECLECGYDLTGNVSGVCPECGEARE